MAERSVYREMVSLAQDNTVLLLKSKEIFETMVCMNSSASGIGAHNSYCGCERCEDPGENLAGCVRFTWLNAPLRRDEDWHLYNRELLDNAGRRGPPNHGDVHRRRETPLDKYPVVTPVRIMIVEQ